MIWPKRPNQFEEARMTTKRKANEIANFFVSYKEIALLLPLLIILIALFLFPIVKILFTGFYDNGFTLKHFHRIFTTPIYMQVLLNTLKISMAVTLFSVLLGYPVAYLFYNISDRTRNLLISIVLIPFWTSVLVRTYGWMVLLGKNGLINNMLLKLGVISTPVPLMYNEPGVYLGMTQILLPFMILPLYSVISKIDRNLLKAGEILGASPLSVFTKIFFPLSIPGVATGSILVFLLALGFFITPALLGGRKEIMIAVLIADQIDVLLNWSFAAALAFILLITTFGVLFISNKLFKLDRIIRQI
jgi:putative spermidine/putrescine transport system permease protein